MAIEDMLEVHEFSVEISVPASVGAPASMLIETIGDALMDYDSQGRLFRGRKCPDGTSCLMGTAVGHEKTERKMDPIASIRSRPPETSQSKAIRGYIQRRRRLNDEIQRRMDRLRDLDEQLSTLYYDAWFAEAREYTTKRKALGDLVDQLEAEFGMAAS